MAKINLTPVTGGFNLSTINNNFDKIATELNDKVFYRNNPVDEPNQLITDLDVNGKHIYNLPLPTLDHEPIRLKDFNELVPSLGELQEQADRAEAEADRAKEEADRAAAAAVWGGANNLILFSTYSEAEAAAVSLPNDQVVEVGIYRYTVQGGILTDQRYSEQLRTDMSIPLSTEPIGGFSTYSQLESYTGTATVARITGKGIAGLWRKTGDTAKTPNGGTVLLVNGIVWEREFDGPILSSWFEIEDGQECSGKLENFFKAAFDNKTDWVLGYGEFLAATMGVVQIKTSGVSYGTINAPKSNNNFRIELIRDLPGTTIDPAGWSAQLLRGTCDNNAMNALGKNLFLLSTEVLMERIGSGGSPYRKQEFIRVGGSGSFTTALTCTYNSKTNLTVTSHTPSTPIDVTLNIKRTGSVTGPTDRGSIVVTRDNVTLRPSVLSSMDTQPLPVAIEVSYCADCTIEKPVVQGFQYGGLGYGILAGTTIGLTVNQPDIRDCRHAFTAAYDVDTVLNGGTYADGIDSHWTNRFVANDVKVYSPVGAAPFGFAGYDVTLNNPQVFGGRSLCVIRNDTPSLGGKVVINNPTVISPGYYAQYYVFGYSSLFGPGETLPVFTNPPALPDSVIISNATIVANTNVIYGAYIPAMNAPHTGLGLCKIEGSFDSNTLTIGIAYTKRSAVQSRASRLVIDANCDFRTGSALYLSTADADTTKAAMCELGSGVRNADLRFSPNSVLTIIANGGQLNNIELDSPINFSNQQYVFSTTKMGGGFVRSTLKNTAFMGVNFGGTYSQFPAAADVTLVGCVRSSPQGALPADIRGNVVAPFA